MLLTLDSLVLFKFRGKITEVTQGFLPKRVMLTVTCGTVALTQMGKFSKK